MVIPPQEIEELGKKEGDDLKASKVGKKLALEKNGSRA